MDSLFNVNCINVYMYTKVEHTRLHGHIHTINVPVCRYYELYDGLVSDVSHLSIEALLRSALYVRSLIIHIHVLSFMQESRIEGLTTVSLPSAPAGFTCT